MRKLTSLEDWRDAERVWKDYQETGDLEMLRNELQTNVLITNTPGAGEGLLYRAFADKDVNAADLLIEIGIDDLDKAVSKGWIDLHDIICESDDDPTMVEWAIEKGVDVELFDELGHWTPLLRAACHGHRKIAKVLLERGANIDSRGIAIDGGWTPLMNAAYYGKREMVEFLLEHGADSDVVTYTDHPSETPETADMIASNRGHTDISQLISEHREKHSS